DPKPDFKKARKWDQERKAYDLEKSWEFERPIPEWLKRIHKHRKDLDTTVDTTDLESYSRVAKTAIWWRIIDACDQKLTEIIMEQEFISLKKTLLSYLPSDWKVVEPPVERCLHSIAMLDENGLKKVAKITAYHGICGAIKKIRRILATSIKIEEDNPFLVSPATEITTSNDIIKDEDAHHPDVRYIIELLRYTYEMIDKKIPQRKNSERDIDVIFKSHMFSCFDKIMDFRFGEIVSRASRQRHILAIGASDKAEGYHTDWLFTKHDFAKDLTWGQEFSFCEKAGSKIENAKKFLDNTFKVQKTLRDMHQTLMEAVSQAGGAEFDIPTQFDELGKIATIARVILNVKNSFKQTIRTFTLMKEASEKNKNSKENVVIPQRIKENMTPKTKRTKRALEPSNVNNTQ
ncbi:3836_t:CDS:2, partial [Gigaspora rosea]